MFSQEIKQIDMRFVCRKDVQQMLVQRARSVYWKNWVAKHEHEGLKEGVWPEPALVLLRKRAKGVWTERHRYVAKKDLLGKEVGRKIDFDIGWSDISQCQACQMEEGTEQHRLYHCLEWHAVRREIPESSRKWEQKATTSKKEWKWQRGVVVHPLSESQWNRGHFSMKKWESEKPRSWGMPGEGSRGRGTSTKVIVAPNAETS